METIHTLGTFLRSRRERLDPKTQGLGGTRRRTPGLRREEVAQRAGLSVTWYTWLEQGRGGAPSSEALEAIADALVLTRAERAHMFQLALGHAPTVQLPSAPEVPARLQAILDALDGCPAFVRDACWDVLAWNRAAVYVLTDYTQLAPEERNILKLLFTDTQTLDPSSEQWHHARLVVESFRLETQRVGLTEQAQALVAQLHATSDAFAQMWSAQDVRAQGLGTKRVVIPGAGELVLEYVCAALDEPQGLSLVIYAPSRPEDRARIHSLTT